MRTHAAQSKPWNTTPKPSNYAAATSTTAKSPPRWATKTNPGAYLAVQRGLADRAANPPTKSARSNSNASTTSPAGSSASSRPATMSSPAGSGKVARHPDTGEPLIDNVPNMQAGLALLRDSGTPRPAPRSGRAGQGGAHHHRLDRQRDPAPGTRNRQDPPA